ncbi:hypothetical protein HAX54_023753, partial [Datura stramonium]|nr:hypothetical protein [Datura stramonium]
CYVRASSTSRRRLPRPSPIAEPGRQCPSGNTQAQPPHCLDAILPLRLCLTTSGLAPLTPQRTDMTRDGASHSHHYRGGGNLLGLITTIRQPEFSTALKEV